MYSFLPFTGSLVIFYAFGHFLGYKFRSRVPQGKGFEVGLASFIGIVILGSTVFFFFPAVRDPRYLRNFLSAFFGLAFGFGYSIGRKRLNKTR